MITIEKRNGIWEAYTCGALLTYNKHLDNVLKELLAMSAEIEEETEE